MKKIIIVVISLMLCVFSCVGCGNEENSNSNSETKQENPMEEEDFFENSGKISEVNL